MKKTPSQVINDNYKVGEILKEGMEDNKKMRVIDLLNKIANGEEVPKYVHYYNMLKDKTDIMMVCKENIFYKLDQLEIQLNSRIEPVEEKKIPKKLEDYDFDDDFDANTKCECLRERMFKIEDKINEIIEYLEENK